MTPTERNSRRLIAVLVECFPNGALCEDLRRQFEVITSLHRQTFYSALRYCKKQRWIVGGGNNQPYSLNEDGCWKLPVTSIEAGLERDRLEYLANSQAEQLEELTSQLRDWSGGGNGVALSNLVQIVSDSAANTRQRLRAAAAVLSYKVDDVAVITFVKGFLESLCASADIATDYRIEAGELLRRFEAPKIVPVTERLPVRPDPAKEPEKIIPLAELIRQRRAYCAELMAREVELGLRPPLPTSEKTGG